MKNALKGNSNSEKLRRFDAEKISVNQWTKSLPAGRQEWW